MFWEWVHVQLHVTLLSAAMGLQSRLYFFWTIVFPLTRMAWGKSQCPVWGPKTLVEGMTIAGVSFFSVEWGGCQQRARRRNAPPEGQKNQRHFQPPNPPQIKTENNTETKKKTGLPGMKARDKKKKKQQGPPTKETG